MMTLENKETNYEIDGKKASYSELILHCLNVPPADGFNRVEMKLRDKLEGIIKDSNGSFEFETTDANDLKRIVAFPGWLDRNKDVLQFLEDVEAMEETK